jgi:hypothetical protein
MIDRIRRGKRSLNFSTQKARQLMEFFREVKNNEPVKVKEEENKASNVVPFTYVQPDRSEQAQSKYRRKIG